MQPGPVIDNIAFLIQRLKELRAVSGADAQVDDIHAEQLLNRVAEHLQKDLVTVDHAPLACADENALPGLLYRRTLPCLTGSRHYGRALRCFQPFQFGNMLSQCPHVFNSPRPRFNHGPHSSPPAMSILQQSVLNCYITKHNTGRFNKPSPVGTFQGSTFYPWQFRR